MDAAAEHGGAALEHEIHRGKRRRDEQEMAGKSEKEGGHEGARLTLPHLSRDLIGA